MGFSSWSGRHRLEAEPFVASDPAQVAAEVADARAAGARLRVVGSGHSFVPFWQPGDRLLSLDGWQGLDGVEGRRATLRAGTPIHAIGALLESHGLALANQGDIDRQTLAGAVATGTHGTGAGLGSLSAQVVGLELVDGRGQTRALESADELAAARVSLGLLGVLTQVTLETVPLYGLHERSWLEPVDATLEALAERLAGHRHFEFWWLPREDRAVAKTLDAIELPARPRLEEIPFGEAGERYGPSWRIFPSTRERRFNEMEYAVPADAGPACFRRVRERILDAFPKLPWPVEYRVVAGDDGWLSPTQGAAVATISVHQGAEREPEPLFDACEPVLREHGGRPHWGKMHRLDRGALAALYPRHADFVARRAEHDPDAVFANDYLRALFG